MTGDSEAAIATEAFGEELQPASFEAEEIGAVEDTAVPATVAFEEEQTTEQATVPAIESETHETNITAEASAGPVEEEPSAPQPAQLEVQSESVETPVAAEATTEPQNETDVAQQASDEGSATDSELVGDAEPGSSEDDVEERKSE
jgi:hypothetical protein